MRRSSIDTQLREALLKRDISVDICVLVGGSVTGRQSDTLKTLCAPSVAIRILFPHLRSPWLKDYINGSGASIEDYRGRIQRNSIHARGLGTEVDVRFHTRPVAAWFVVLDRKAVFTKPIAIHGGAELIHHEDQSIADRFTAMFTSIWNGATENSTVPACGVFSATRVATPLKQCG